LNLRADVSYIGLAIGAVTTLNNDKGVAAATATASGALNAFTNMFAPALNTDGVPFKKQNAIMYPFPIK
jgi:hypothetical protein